MKKKIIIFGATGGTGTHVVKQALDRGYLVSAFVRNPDKLNGAREKVRIFQGDVLNSTQVSAAIKGHDSVICTLGMPANDRSALREEGTRNIVNGMKAHGIQRFICQTSLGFGNSKALLPWHMKYFIVPYVLKHAFLDHEKQEQVIESSDLDWTIIRPGNMTNGKLTGNYRYGFGAKAKIKLKVSRADVAHFMLTQLDQPESSRMKLGISY